MASIDMREYEISLCKYFKVKQNCAEAFIAGISVMYAYLGTAPPEDQMVCVFYSDILVSFDGKRTGE